MTDLSDLRWFLAIRVTRDVRKQTLWLSQVSYIKKIAYQFLVFTPIKGKVTTPSLSVKLTKNEQHASAEEIKYHQQIIGSILYAPMTTRPDIAYVVSLLCTLSSNPSGAHIYYAKRLLQQYTFL